MYDRDKIIMFLAKLLHKIIMLGPDHISEDEFQALDNIVGCWTPDATSDDFIW